MGQAGFKSRANACSIILSLVQFSLSVLYFYEFVLLGWDLGLIGVNRCLAALHLPTFFKTNNNNNKI